MSYSPGLDLTNLLLGLAWLGELDRRQIKRLWFVDKSESTVEKILTQLRKDGLIAKRAWSIRDEERGVTVPQLARWSLTAKGQALVKASDQYPARPAPVRQQRLIPHDIRTTETIVCLIELGRRSRLSGLYIAHEVRLDPEEKRPVCDALVVIQYGTFNQPNLVPWSSDPAIEDEGRVRFAIEADNDTEPLGVIAGKARAYRRLVEDNAWAAWWQQRYGPLPIPLWVVPSKARAKTVHNQWKRAWPDGRWLIATDEGLQQNEMLSWERRNEAYVTIGFKPLQPKLPAPPTQPPAQPQQTVVPALPAPAPAPPTLPAQQATVISPPQTVLTASVPSPQPSPALSPVSAAPRRRIEPGPTLADFEATVPQHPERSIWLDIAWDVLCWAASLFWTALCWVASVLWVALKLPWRILRAIWRWREGLGYELAANLRLFVFTLALVAGGAMLVLHPPSWLADRMPAMPSLMVDAETDAPAWPTPEASLLTPNCPAVRVTAVRLNLRTEPDLQATALGKLQAGETPTVLYCEDDQVADGYTWWEVVGEDGIRGWAATEWLEEAEAQP